MLSACGALRQQAAAPRKARAQRMRYSMRRLQRLSLPLNSYSRAMSRSRGFLALGLLWMTPVSACGDSGPAD